METILYMIYNDPTGGHNGTGRMFGKNNTLHPKNLSELDCCSQRDYWT